MAGERKITVSFDGKDVGLGKAADRAADDVEQSGKKIKDSFENIGEESGRRFKEGVGREADGIGDEFDDAGDEAGGSFLDGLGGKITAGIAAVGIAGAALLVEGLTSAMDLEATVDRLGAQLGNAEFGKEMGKIAGDLYKDGFGESVGDTADAIRKVWQNGLIPEDAADADIERVTGKILTFSDVLEQDMDMTTQAIKSMITSGIADSSEEALDVMTRGVQQGADKAGDLAETFQEYSTNFAALGLSGADATGLMVQGLNAGARDADKVADSIKEFGIRAKDGSDTTRDAFKALGIDAETAMLSVAAGGDSAKLALQYTLEELQKIEDPLERNTIAAALFGTQSEDMQAALMGLDLDSAALGLGEVAGSTEKLGSAYDNASSKIESFKRTALMGLTEFVGSTVIPGIESLVGTLRDNLGPAFTTIKDAATEFWNALTTGMTEDEGTPIERVALAIRDAWQQLTDVYNTELKPALEDLIATGQRLIGEVDWTTVWQELGPILAAAGAAFVAFMTTVIVVVATIIQNISNTITKIQEFYDKHEWFRNLVGGIWDWISTKVTTALNIIAGIMNLVTSLMRGDWSAAWNALKSIASNAWDSMTADFRGVANTIRSIGGAMWNPISAGLSSVVSTVTSQLNRLISTYNNTVGRIPGVADIPTVGSAVRKTSSTIPKFAKGGLAFGPTLAMVGDNPGAARDPEVIAPLSKLQGLTGGGSRITIGSDGSAYGRFLVDELRKAVKNRGGVDVVFA